jgi:ectoine hydroxylase-related dioxygenase (phytanoyl-CoA dioxygenase family)
MAGELSQRQLDEWDQNGLVELRSFFPTAPLQRVSELVDRLWKDRQSHDNPLVIDVFDGMPEGRRIYFRAAPDEAKRFPYKLNDLYLEHREVRDLMLAPALAGVLDDLLGGAPMLCNTINFEYGPGQENHVDTLYMPPKEPNRMVAAWIALEDVSPAAGPLRYYPGSHKIPPFLFSHGRTDAIPAEMPSFRKYIREELEKRGSQPSMFVARAGDALIWHAQLLHGGHPIEDKSRTRKSIVAHYFRAQDYYHRFWRLRREHKDAYYYTRPHQTVA